jgi:hypothetical protein
MSARTTDRRDQQLCAYGLLALALFTVPLTTACGGGSYAYASSAPAARADYGGEETSGLGGMTAPEPTRAMFAQAATTTTSTGAGTTSTGPSTPSVPSDPGDRATTAHDARDTSGPLLIYTATIAMAVFEVRATQTQLLERARSMGGVLAIQTDDRLVLRVPAERFDDFLSGIGELGDVLARDIQAQDVGEEFRDVAIRIRNLEVTRQRVEALLAQARDVEQALAVQRELERITTELEALRGRQRFLADRIAFSTITFVFRALPREQLAEEEIFQLPFRWLEQLGLPALLDVR